MIAKMLDVGGHQYWAAAIDASTARFHPRADHLPIAIPLVCCIGKLATIHPKRETVKTDIGNVCHVRTMSRSAFAFYTVTPKSCQSASPPLCGRAAVEIADHFAKRRRWRRIAALAGLRRDISELSEIAETSRNSTYVCVGFPVTAIAASLIASECVGCAWQV